MYGFGTKRTFTHPKAKYGPPPRSLVGSPASWAGELEGDRAHNGTLRNKEDIGTRYFSARSAALLRCNARRNDVAVDVGSGIMSGTLSHLAIASFSIAAGATVEAILGFGCNIVWMAFFPLFTTVRESVGVHQPLGLCLNLLILQKTWRHCNAKDLQPLGITVPVGILAGLLVVALWPVRLINASLGTFLLCYTSCCAQSKAKCDGETTICMDVKAVKEEGSLHSTESGNASHVDEVPILLQSHQMKDSADARVYGFDLPCCRRILELCHIDPSMARDLIADMSIQKAVAGFFGGCLTSAFGTGGPAILIYAREAGWESEPSKFRANLQLIFFLMHVMAILSMIAGGMITLQTARASASLLPALVAGGFVGNKLSDKIPKALFKKLIIIGLQVMGTIFFIRAII